MNTSLRKMFVKGAIGLTGSIMIGYLIKMEYKIEKRIDEHYEEKNEEQDSEL